MDILDHDYSVHTRQGGGDEKLFVQFHNWYKADAEKSEEEGRPIFNDDIFIRIITPGNRDNIIDRPIRPEDKMRFPKQWTQFQAGESAIGSGTRLEEWTPMPRSMVEELRYFGFRTVEHVAEAGDGALSKMPGLRSWADRAKTFLAAAKDASILTKAEAEKAALQATIDSLQEQITELAKLARPAEGSVALPSGKGSKSHA